MTRDEFIAENRIEAILEKGGVTILGGGDERKCKCPLHKDNNPSFSFSVSKQLWKCYAGCGQGSVIDLLAIMQNTSPAEILKQNCSTPRFNAPEPKVDKPEGPKRIDKIYSYRNAFGEEVFQVLRYIPKDFRQRHAKAGGGWIYSMEGVERVLYRLPEVTASSEVWLCEGEKDADNLSAIGFCGTTNVGGASKWMDGYSDSLAGKNVIICGDNDEAGKKHVKKVFDCIAGKAKTVKIISLPSTFKDVSDFIAAQESPEVARKALSEMRDSASAFVAGIKLNIFQFSELEETYARYAENIKQNGLNLGDWLPSFNNHIRPIVPGELVFFLGGTGVGKTAILSHCATITKLPTLFFELELPAELMFERVLAMKAKRSCQFVEDAYRTGERFGSEYLNSKFGHLFICTESRLKVSDIENTIMRAELKMGQRPKVVLIDYVGLINGSGGSRYERVSQIAEDLKVMAKATQTIVICASQISRKGKDDSGEVAISDGKDSGSIENSAGLVIGAWRDVEDRSLMHMRILKNTKGIGGKQIVCNYNGEFMSITERSPINPEEYQTQSK